MGNTATEPAKVFRAPFTLELEKDQKYDWCACGFSKNQPFCDGSHVLRSKLSYQQFKVNETKVYSLCGCKITKNPPFCDGAHTKLDW